MVSLVTVKGLSFSPVSQTLLLLSVALLFVLLVVTAYARGGERIGAGRRRLLVVLRIAAALCVVLALLRPVLSLEADESRRPCVYVLVDGSASMKLPLVSSGGEAGGVSRAQVALRAARGLLEDVSPRFETRVFHFSDSLRELDPALEEVPLLEGGARSALGTALQELATRVGTDAAAAVVFSDGSSSFGPDPSAVAKRLRFPVFTVAAAREDHLRDIEITEVLHPASGQPGAEIPVLVRVKGHGLENLDAPVRISEEETVVSRGMVTLAGSAQTEVSLSVRPGAAGIHFYRVSVPVVEGEASSENNSVFFPLAVLSEKVKVLHIYGDLTWDFTFLKRQLESDARLEAEFASASGGKVGPSAVSPAVTPSPALLEQSSVVILSGGAAGRIGVETWRALEEFVRSGGGLFVVGASGLDETPAAALDVLPARVRAFELWGPKQYLNCRVTFEGLNHAICDVARDASSSADRWKDLSPLVGSHVIEEAKQGSSVLIMAETGEKSFPVVVAGSYGRGRVLLAAATGLWRWGFSLPAVGGNEELFARFVSNAVWWLSESEKESSREVGPVSWVFKNGEEVVFAAIGGTGGQEPRLEVTDESGELLVPALIEGSGPDTLYLKFGILKPGTYEYRAYFEEESGKAGSSGRFVVDTMGPEYQNLFPDPGLLAYVAEASGGRFFTAEQVDRLAGDIQTFGGKASVAKQVRLWNHPLLFAIFAASMTLEWWLRRRSGLP